MRAGFPHSEIFGSKLACQLPEAYRRLQRPSSPVVAKASITCTCSLDPITLSSARRQTKDHRKRLVSTEADKAPALVMQSLTQTNPVLRKPGSLHFFRIVKEQPNKTKCTEKAWPSRCTARCCVGPGGANRDRTGDLLLAKQALSQLSYGPESGRPFLTSSSRRSGFCGGSGWTRTIDPRLIKTVL